MTGKHVVLLPLRNLEPGERFPLAVTLADGTELPFLLGPPARDAGERVDQQVNVFQVRESNEALRSSLNDALRRKRILEEENTRLRKEEASADHALAALLASGSAQQTPFVAQQNWSLKESDTELTAVIFSGKGKAAVLFSIKNLHPQAPWKLSEARLTTAAGGHVRAVAVRSAPSSIPPGATGSIAVVADKSAFMGEGRPENLALEIFRDDGYRQAYVLLDPRLTGR